MSLYIILFIGVGILSFAVSRRLKNKFRKYSQIRWNADLTGREIAEKMLRDNRIHDVEVISVPGKLTDHYNPANKTVNLSEAVYHGRSAAAAAVAAHECGHAVQHATAYSFLEFRSAMVPVQNVSARILNMVVLFMFFGGMFIFGMEGAFLNTALLVIIGCYTVITLFSLVTLPVEFDASKRALAWIQAQNIASPDEYGQAKDALKWAAMTYVVAALGSIVGLLYWVSIYLGGRD
ncbi:zinc metallopeptidase [Tunicatimonas pelagia]|uniref:zinc metallopeptidase n=1 Tax=Tunicatimonas pelagia TaxID=931531 RepID=UPI0026656860|nr:zinc metallopeptidase [Tunicatimonas pelagia]WKN45932.1 zinc metallopeptidase [Tunicatimonas pelagia]